MTNKVISFDVFDTALLRKVYKPSDIFKLIEKKVGNDFYNKRIEAQARAAEEDPFCTIEDIYNYLPEFDMNVEIEIEMDNCYANPELYAAYNEKDFIFISDMYLPSSVIKAMLEKAGYKNPQVFVSCEEKAWKADGTLFEKVQETGYEITKHMGDNYVADILGAKKAGIENVYFVPALHNKKLNLPALRNPVLKKFIALTEDSFMTPVEKLAFFVAPIMVGFTKWVLSKRKPGQKIFFLARDMYIPYLIAQRWGASDIYYLHASRRSMAGVCLRSDNEELKKRVKEFLPEEDVEEKRSNAAEAIKYLKSMHLKKGDIIVDIGYAGTIQAAIESALDIKLQGLHLQKYQDSPLLKDMNVEQFFERNAIHFAMIAEFPFCSPENCVELYKNKKPIFKPDVEKRKEFSKHIVDLIMNIFLDMPVAQEEISVFDLEQLFIQLQYYPSDGMMKVYNEHIFANKESVESIINFSIERIKRGELLDLYDKSYCKPLFCRMLSQIEDYAHLTELLK